MHLGEISFCDRVGYNIKSEEHKKLLLDELDRCCNFKIIQKHFQKYDAQTPQLLQQRPHLVGVRTNGNPYLLLLTQYNFVNQCIFVDKKIQHGYFYPRMILTKFWFDDALFQKSTVIDGEMVRVADKKWIFLMNDLLVENGVWLERANAVKRINRLYEILDKQFRADPQDGCRFQVKRYFRYEECATQLPPFLASLPYTCRGLYFKPLFLKFRDVLMNFDDSLIQKVAREKFKTLGSFLTKEAVVEAAAKCLTTDADLQPREQPSEDSGASQSQTKTKTFYGRKTNYPDVYHLYETPHPSAPFHVACVSKLSTSQMMRALFKDCNPTDHRSLVCAYAPRFAKWEPLKLAE